MLLTPGDPYFVPRSDGRLVIGATREEAGWDPSLTAGGVAWLLNRAIEVVPELEAALDRALDLTPAGGELVVLPTYTAMLALRDVVAKRGFVRHYWEAA